jgi:hypothetical protein
LKVEYDDEYQDLRKERNSCRKNAITEHLAHAMVAIAVVVEVVRLGADDLVEAAGTGTSLVARSVTSAWTVLASLITRTLGGCAVMSPIAARSNHGDSLVRAPSISASFPERSSVPGTLR